jgi:hypothetical protein
VHQHLKALLLTLVLQVFLAILKLNHKVFQVAHIQLVQQLSPQYTFQVKVDQEVVVVVQAEVNELYE